MSLLKMSQTFRKCKQRVLAHVVSGAASLCSCMPSQHSTALRAWMLTHAPPLRAIIRISKRVPDNDLLRPPLCLVVVVMLAYNDLRQGDQRPARECHRRL